SRERWAAAPVRDGFLIEPDVISGRFDGAEYRLGTANGETSYAGPGFAVVFEERDLLGTVEGDASTEVDLTYFHIMNLLRAALFAPSEVNYVNSW
ncbi:MAG: glutamate synthase, partial [Gemmatimonadota bacterium]